MHLLASDGPRIARSKKYKPRQKKNKAALTTSPPHAPAVGPKPPISRSPGLDLSERKTFLDLPAELRNQIYALSLPTDEAVDIKDSWPSILFTHKQVYNEALPIFVGSNTFSAHIKDRRDAAFTAWLDFVKGMRSEFRTLITCVTITFSGKVLDWDRQGGCYTPDFKFYNQLITRIKAAGLTGSQITFPGLRPEALATSSFEEAREVIIPLHLLNRHILTPLLRHHDLLDRINPPVDVEKQLREEFEVLGLSSVQAWLALDVLKGAEGCAVGPPKQERWFKWWVAGGEQTREDLKEEWREEKRARGRKGRRAGGGRKGAEVLGVGEEDD